MIANADDEKNIVVKNKAAFNVRLIVVLPVLKYMMKTLLNNELSAFLKSLKTVIKSMINFIKNGRETL